MEDYLTWWKKRIKTEPGLRWRIKDIKKKIPLFKQWIDGRYQSTKWLDNRWFALLRDNYTCQHCGYQSREGLHVHHIYGRGLEKTEQLMTFCSVCHPAEMDNDFWDCLLRGKQEACWREHDILKEKIHKLFLDYQAKI